MSYLLVALKMAVRREAVELMADSSLRSSKLGQIRLAQAVACRHISLDLDQVDPSGHRRRRLVGLEVDQQAHCRTALA
jgi:hypothetical protein